MRHRFSPYPDDDGEEDGGGDADDAARLKDASYEAERPVGYFVGACGQGGGAADCHAAALGAAWPGGGGGGGGPTLITSLPYSSHPPQPGSSVPQLLLPACRCCCLFVVDIARFGSGPWTHFVCVACGSAVILFPRLLSVG